MTLILVVEDDEAFREMLELKLTKLGYEVASARNGKDVLRMVKDFQVDLVITDLVMPEKEGLELIMELKEHVPHLRIIATSGGGRMGNVDYLKTAEKFGAARTLKKPFTDGQLTEAIQFALGNL